MFNNLGEVQNTRNLRTLCKTKRKETNGRPGKHNKGPKLDISNFFRHYETFFRICFVTTKAPPSIFYIPSTSNSFFFTVASFFRQFNAIGPLFCSFVEQHQLELRTSKTYSKRQNLVQNNNIDVQNLKNILRIPLWCYSIGFFRHCATCFGLCTKGSSLRLFRYFATQWMSKNPKGPPFTFFGTLTQFKNLIYFFRKRFFRKFFFKSPRVPPATFFHILLPTGVSQSPKGPFFLQF